MPRLFTFIAICLHLFAGAQDPPARISRELAAMIDVPALVPETQQAFTAPSTVIHFNKQIKISNGQNSAVTYLYINTQTGETATRTGRPEAVGDGSININDEQFTLTYYRPVPGIIINFYNSKKKGVLKHFYSTLNTEINPVSFPAFEKTTVTKHAYSTNVLPQNFLATPYKTSDTPSTSILLCGGPTPSSLQLKRFIGFAGIGYVKTNRGIYMVTEIVTMHGRFEAKQWQHTENSIDLGQFTSVETEMQASMEQSLNKELAGLDGRRDKIKGDCADLQLQLNEFERQSTLQRRTDMQGIGSRNFITDSSALLTLGNMVNPERQVEGILLSIEVSLCNLDAQERKLSENDERQRSRIIAKRACLIENRQRTNQCLTEMKNIRATSSSARDMMRLQGQKRDVFFQYMKKVKPCK